MIISDSRCDRCGCSTQSQTGDYCLHCGYPIDPATEEEFLKASLRYLERVALYGGASLTITQLIVRYRQRQLYLLSMKDMPDASMPAAPSTQAIKKVKPAELAEAVTLLVPAAPSTQAIQRVKPIELVETSVHKQASPHSSVPLSPTSSYVSPPLQTTLPQSAAARVALVPSTDVPTPVSPVQPTRERVFASTALLGNQMMNTIVSVGALLVFFGSLRFITTTSNLLLACIIIVIMHSFCGIIGAITHRFQHLRIATVIYTATFALQVPLIGFTAYRLSAGHLIGLPVSTLLAIAAAYAVIIYGCLALYYTWKIFRYLYVLSLVTADLAICASLHLGYWWWPAMLMVLALLALTSDVHTRESSQMPIKHKNMLNKPMRALMFNNVVICCFGVFITTLSSLNIDGHGRPNPEMRFAIMSMVLLLLAWTALFIWRSGRTGWGVLLPYCFLACVIACSYTFAFDTTGYALVLTAVALVYHGLKQFAPHLLQPFAHLEQNLEWLALLLVALVPWVVSPLLLSKLFLRVYHPSLFSFQVTGATVVAIATLLVGLLLTLNVLESHTGLHKAPALTQRAWCWLLVLSGFILNWTYGIVILSLHAEPAWCWLGLTLILVILAVAVRRMVSAIWADPLDVLAIIASGFTLLLSLNRGTAYSITLLLGFAALSYAIVLYQHRRKALWLPCIFAGLAGLLLLSALS